MSNQVYHSWTKKDGGKDDLSAMTRLLNFLLNDDGENLKLYIGGRQDSTFSKTSKKDVINRCVDYFLEQGVTRSNPQLKTKINNLLRKQYLQAYDKWSSQGSQNGNERLNKICPEFYRLKDVMDQIEAISPSATKKALQCNTSSVCNNRSVHSPPTDKSVYDEPLTYNEESVDEISDSSEGSDSSIDQKFTFPRKRQCHDSVLRDTKVALLERKDRLRRDRYEVCVDTIIKMAELFKWSEEKVEQKVKEVYNKNYSK